MGGSKAAVLVVDDDEELRNWLAAELTQRDFWVERASSGPMALEVQAKRRFDLALIDLRMPGMDGIETLTALKQRDPDLEAVMATGHATVPAAVASMKLGAFDFIQKPYTLRELLPLMERALEKSRLQGTLALHQASTTLLGTHKSGDLLDEAAMVLKRMLGAHSVGFSLTATKRVAWFPGSGLKGTDETIVPVLAALLQPGSDGVRVQEAPGKGPFGSAIVTALISRSVDIGALALLRTGDTPPFTEEEYRRALVFSGQLALALDNARLHEELSAKVEEVTRTRDALIFAEKLALTGQLTAGVAHEISTPLTYVRFNLEFVVSAADKLVEQIKSNATGADKVVLARACESLAELRTAAADAREGVERIVKIVGDLNMFARPDHDQQARLQLSKVLEWASSVAAVQIKPKAQLIRDYQADAVVRGNETRLGQVFVNLLVNAAQAIPAGEPEKHSVTLTVKAQDEGVVVEVTDTGSGIDTVAAAHIFEPFFTTKPPGKGTGLGLSICRSIVTEHGGSINFESAPGKGTTFRVGLPYAGADESAEPTVVPPTVVPPTVVPPTIM